MKHPYWKQLFIPPLLVAFCWGVFMYGGYRGLSRYMSPLWDYATVSCFAALVCGFIMLPVLALISRSPSFRATPEDAFEAQCSYLGYGVAWLVVLAGFLVLPWGEFVTD